MALNIKSDEAHQLARALSEATGRSMTEAVTDALRRSLAAQPPSSESELVLAEVRAIQRFVADLPDRDPRSPEEILGYGADGLSD